LYRHSFSQVKEIFQPFKDKLEKPLAKAFAQTDTYLAMQVIGFTEETPPFTEMLFPTTMYRPTFAQKSINNLNFIQSTN